MNNLLYTVISTTIILMNVSFANSETLGEIIINDLSGEVRDETIDVVLQNTAKNILGEYIGKRRELGNALIIAKKELTKVNGNPALEKLWAVRVANASDAISNLESTGKLLFNKLGVKIGLIDNLVKAPSILEGLDVALDGKKFIDATRSGDLEKANRLARQTYVKGSSTVAFIVGAATFKVTVPAAIFLGAEEYFNSKTQALREKHSDWAKDKLSQYDNHLNNANLENSLRRDVSILSQGLPSNDNFDADKLRQDIQSKMTSTLDGYLAYIDNELAWFESNRTTAGLYNTKEDIEITNYLKGQRDIIHGLKIAANGRCSHVGNCAAYAQYVNAFKTIIFDELESVHQDNQDNLNQFEKLKTRVENLDTEITPHQEVTDLTDDNKVVENNDLSAEEKTVIGSSTSAPDPTPLPQPEPTNNNNDFPFLGFIAGKIEGEGSLFTGNLYTGRPAGGDAPLGARGEARINRNGINTFYSDNLEPSISVRINESESADGFRYSDWGEWNGSGVTVNNFSGARAERGYYVIGHSTPSDAVPRSGTASYSGKVRGIAFSGENIGGTVNLNANFSQRNINARLGLTRQNGDRWVNVQTGNISYERSLSQDFEVNFAGNNSTVTNASGDVINGAGANVRGMFVGTEAQEVIGDFAVFGVPDDVGGVDGVYRARQSGQITTTPRVDPIGRTATSGPIFDAPRELINSGRPSLGGGPIPQEIFDSLPRAQF